MPLKQGDVLATVHASTEADAELAKTELTQSITLLLTAHAPVEAGACNCDCRRSDPSVIHNGMDSRKTFPAMQEGDYSCTVNLTPSPQPVTHSRTEQVHIVMPGDCNQVFPLVRRSACAVD